MEQSGGPDIPQELQKKLSDALFELCIYIHTNVGSSSVLISLQHASDALAKQSTTAITVMGGGIAIRRDPNGPSNAPQNQAEVDKVISELMAKAKAKGAAPKPEEKKPDAQ